jgi:hypothetical protein
VRIRSLADFGQVAQGKEALGVFLGYVQGIVGDKQGVSISSLRARGLWWPNRPNLQLDTLLPGLVPMGLGDCLRFCCNRYG